MLWAQGILSARISNDNIKHRESIYTVGYQLLLVFPPVIVIC